MLPGSRKLRVVGGALGAEASSQSQQLPQAAPANLRGLGQVLTKLNPAMARVCWLLPQLPQLPQAKNRGQIKKLGKWARMVGLLAVVFARQIRSIRL